MTTPRRVLGGALAAAGTLFLGAAWFIDHAGRQDTAQPADVLVVLGARVEPSGQPSETLAARVRHAVVLFHRGLAPRILFSGGVGDFGPSEASVARDLAVSLGVPASACELEAESHSTRENVQRSLSVMRSKEWRTAVVVTDPYHLPRALRLFAKQGGAVTGSPVLAAPRHQSLSARLWWTAREVAALTQW